jgi:hypothetical protein
MYINRFEDVIGVITLTDIVEGRFVLLKENTVTSYDFGSRSDLPGVAVPATAEEAKRARYALTWTVTNGKPPYYQPMPSFEWSMRQGGWDQATNLPMTDTTIYTTYPGHQNGKTIPSGYLALAFAEGTYTIPSGGYIENVALHVAGAPCIVANTAEDTTDAGKIKYQSTMDERVVGYVERYNSTNGDLTVKVRP